MCVGKHGCLSTPLTKAGIVTLGYQDWWPLLMLVHIPPIFLSLNRPGITIATAVAGAHLGGNQRDCHPLFCRWHLIWEGENVKLTSPIDHYSQQLEKLTEFVWFCFSMPLFRFSKGQLQDNYNIVDNRIVVDSGRSIGDYAKGRELASHLESYVNSWAFEPEQVQKLSLWGTE